MTADAIIQDRVLTITRPIAVAYTVDVIGDDIKTYKTKHESK
jgi:hypothetical protein